MSNAKEGHRFEMELLKTLSENGFWVLRINPNAGGQQPADIIAVKGKYHALIDCKVCATAKGFSFDRVEDNQHSAMSLFHERSGEYGWFALELPDGEIRMLSYAQLMGCESLGMKSLTMREMHNPNFTCSLTEWMQRATAWM